jgi:hypothetical protein
MASLFWRGMGNSPIDPQFLCEHSGNDAQNEHENAQSSHQPGWRIAQTPKTNHDRENCQDED